MKKSLAIMFCLVMVLSVFAGCSKGAASTGSTKSTASSAQTANYKKEVVVGISAQITTLDPQAVSNVAHNKVFKLTHNTLVDLDLKAKKVIPELAESWEWTDSSTLKMNLRKDAYFHNGEQVKSSDVLFTFKRGKDGKGTSAKITAIKSLEASGDFTVIFHLTGPNVDFLDTLSLPACDILSEKALTNDPKEGYKIGSGPWVVSSYVLNGDVTYDRFNKYWAGPMKTEKLKLRYVPESSARVIALQTGEIDLCLDTDINDVDFIQKDKNLELIKYNANSIQFFGFNTSVAPANNKLFRQAIACAINKDEIIKGTLNGNAIVAKSYWGSSMFGFYDGFKGYDYDLARAKELLAKAGYPNGIDLEAIVVSGIRVASAEIMQAQLKKIGVNLIIKEVDSAGMTSMTNEGTHKAFIYGLAFNTAGDDIRRSYGQGSTTNRSKYNNPRVNELMDLAVAELDNQKRMNYYKELQEIAAEDLPIIPLYYTYEFAGARKGLGGITWYESSNNDISGVYVTL